MFYWLAESENNVTTDPLIFWFNGGPGCSSSIGLFFNGPLKLEKELSKRKHVLSKLGSVVYIDTPSPVGFSYSTDKSDPTDDQMTVEDNYKAVKLFLEEYPKFRNHEVIITGYSYAGIYIPMLAGQIIDNKKDFNINLTKIILGAPFLSDELNLKARLEFSYAHGFIDEEVYRNLLKKCCDNKTLEDCDSQKNDNECEDFNEYTRNLPHPEIELYDVNRKCENMEIHEDPENDPKSCTFSGKAKFENYLNRKDTREILRIPEKAGKWQLCQPLENYRSRKIEMVEYIKKAMRNDVKIVLFYGDADFVCPFSEGQKVVERLGIEEIGNGLISTKDQRIIGKYTSYKNLDFLVFKNVGHSLGVLYPEIEFELHRKFFNDQKLDRIFWFNGGPGRSSLTGLFLNGPFDLDSKGREIRKKSLSFTKLGSVVYIESPTPVGFSYSTKDSHPVDDQGTADDYKAILLFLEEYPKFRNHEIFLTGVSYAGMYIPMLVKKIIERNQILNINLKGIAIGAASLCDKLSIKARFEYSYTHGFLDEEKYQNILRGCCENKNLDECNIYNARNKHCVKLKNYAKNIAHSEINIYNVNQQCVNPCKSKHRDKIAAYLNRKEVRETLKIPEEAGKWHSCDTLDPYIDRLFEMDEYVKIAMRNDVRVLLFYGDADMVCPFMMGQKFVERLGIEFHVKTQKIDVPIKNQRYKSKLGGEKKRFLWYLRIVTC
ncbi:unnamed protein product [Caenorhabditis angaria]|uniref:Uncharacterized protein n=1 Tax=Caenorhabditis angaria TaxID=860376 RepID=A0A9P1NAE0_9PELO|nr:unnamed protein product [Caenorhabditis angaria]